jgi:hypothetical protein
MNEATEFIRYTTLWRIERFKNDQDFKNKKIYALADAMAAFKAPQITEFKGNCLLNEGINELFTILCTTSSGTKFNSANSYIGIGDDATAADPSQTGLQAAVNKVYISMDPGYPTYGTLQKAIWYCTATFLVGNFAWNEFTVANGGSDAAKNLNRKVSAQGTKLSGQIWTCALSITFA